METNSPPKYDIARMIRKRMEKNIRDCRRIKKDLRKLRERMDAERQRWLAQLEEKKD